MEIEIKVMWCKGLSSFNFFQKLTVYAAVCISTENERLLLSEDQKQEQKTGVDEEGDGNPEWNHSMKFDLRRLKSVNPNFEDLCVAFELRNQGQLFGDKTIGDVRVPLTELIQSVGGDFVRFVSYEVRSPEGKHNGILDFSYKIIHNNNNNNNNNNNSNFISSIHNISGYHNHHHHKQEHHESHGNGANSDTHVIGDHHHDHHHHSHSHSRLNGNTMLENGYHHHHSQLDDDNNTTNSDTHVIGYHHHHHSQLDVNSTTNSDTTHVGGYHHHHGHHHSQLDGYVMHDTYSDTHHVMGYHHHHSDGSGSGVIHYPKIDSEEHSALPSIYPPPSLSSSFTATSAHYPPSPALYPPPPPPQPWADTPPPLSHYPPPQPYVYPPPQRPQSQPQQQTYGVPHWGYQRPPDYHQW